MPRVAIIGNAGGGKSTLSRRIGASCGLESVEVDGLLWAERWRPIPAQDYESAHAALIAAPNWVVDGLGRRESIVSRLCRATTIVLVDMPLWMHFWLAAERQAAWACGTLDHPPGRQTTPPSTEALFRTIDEVDRTWMPAIRAQCEIAEHRGTLVHRIGSVSALDAFTSALPAEFC